MYESHWRLTQKPFEPGADEKFYYPGESHQAALLKLRYAIENRRGAALLAGASGTGKTMLAGMLAGMLGEPFSPLVRVVFPQMTPSELLAYLAAGLDGAEADNSGVEQSVRRIERFLADNARRGNHAVVILDEAHLLDGPRILETLRLLTNFESGARPALTLLLAAGPGILPVLDRTPQLEERLAVKCLLRAFTPEETAAYVAHRLRAAGATRPVFDDEALGTLHALTQGVARRINRLCDLAMLIAFAEERATIGAAHLEAVNEELVSVAPE
jgi:type II secretory pathway predicted ATPase ExeA